MVGVVRSSGKTTGSTPGKIVKALSDGGASQGSPAVTVILPTSFGLNSLLICLLFFSVLFTILRVSAHIPPSIDQASSSIPFKVPSTDCIHPPYDNCSFYANCLESRYHCGPTGYPLGYGQRFCQSFSDKRSKLSKDGQTWMLKTMHCLQIALVPDVTNENGTMSCSALKHKAIGTHAACYVDNGWCELAPADWLAVAEIVQLRTLFQNWDAMRTSAQAALNCLRKRGRL